MCIINWKEQRERYERRQALSTEEVELYYSWLVTHKFVRPIMSANDKKDIVFSVMEFARVFNPDKKYPARDLEFEALCDKYRK